MLLQASFICALSLSWVSQSDLQEGFQAAAAAAAEPRSGSSSLGGAAVSDVLEAGAPEFCGPDSLMGPAGRSYPFFRHSRRSPAMPQC